MKSFHILLICLIPLVACQKPSPLKSEPSETISETQQVKSAVLSQMIDSTGLLGAVLIFDPQKNSYYSNDFDWATSRHLPASTFKIPNSMIMLESGIMQNDSSMITWHGDERMFKSWEQDMMLRQAFHRSCLPCYQQLTRKLGYEKMQSYTSRLDYGQLVYDSIQFDKFWVEGKSGISQMEQIAFLERRYREELAFSARTHLLTKRLMVAQSNEDFQLSAKTGWSIVDEHHNGWYVGYVQASGQLYYFATNLTPPADYEMSLFSNIRKELTFLAFQRLGIASSSWEPFR